MYPSFTAAVHLDEPDAQLFWQVRKTLNIFEHFIVESSIFEWIQNL